MYLRLKIRLVALIEFKFSAGNKILFVKTEITSAIKYISRYRMCSVHTKYQRRTN